MGAFLLVELCGILSVKTCPICEKSWPSNHANCPTDGALLIDLRELEPGTVIRGKYRIVRQLGRGGMGTVYLAEHILLGRSRALKFISSELSQDVAFLRRFRREAQAAIELQHPNVVQVVDLDQAEDGSPYIAMEYVEGPDLRHALEGGAFPVPRALAIARGIALGLGAAHAKGIIHRDVKPENILLAGSEGKPETPKLLDFGIAAMKESATVASRTHGLLLTPPYAAPEQWKGMAAEELDGRTDLYALGGLLYEMLTGQTCFHAHNTEGWMYQHLHEQPQPPSQLHPELADWPGLDAMVLRLLAKDRDQRFPTAADLLEKLVLAPSEARAATAVLPAPAPRIPTVVESSPPPIPPPAPIPLDPERAPDPVPPPTFPIKWMVATVLLILAVAGIWFATRSSTTKSSAMNSPASSLPEGAFVWTDPATSLMWAKVDNRNDVNWQQATDYCRNLQLVGHSDWRLPTIDELQGIYDQNSNFNGYHVKNNLWLSGWIWSSSQGNAPQEAWNFHFNNGQRYSGGRDYKFSGRALCVRGSTRKGPTPAVNPAPVTPPPAPAGDMQSDALTWTDPATRLMWTKKDNGSDVNWQQATNYCRKLQLAGHTDWRLPAIDELQGIYDANAGGWHVKGKLQLSSWWEWSSSSGNASGEAVILTFASGRGYSDPIGYSSHERALCVRGSVSNSPGPAVNPAPVAPPPVPTGGTQSGTLTWTDPATGLMWAKKDNGSDINWQQATDYCRNLQLAGHSDWRLPNIDELQGIYDANTNVMGADGYSRYVKGNLQLSGWWQWSSSQGNTSGEAWFFNFINVKRVSYRFGNSNQLRALCVRRSGD
jgi:serine/threonine protein kinase